ncbi:BIG/ATPase V1 complex, subunit S1 [Staphylotrichum tortipilum]|uniref:Protein BIG1 n=1 Tax=Staphylotrichum tortipilum TaxID=2831512 RepID=A0AAN6RT34_9PEZI|nr:BIG/ATPase V1 complex, subunit S1 [Staphylotrichum longicolle]
MKLSTTAALLACAASQAQAFSDTSPFILFSTAKLRAPFPPASNLQTASDVFSAAQSLLAGCPTTRYILVSQPNLHAADIRDALDSCRLTPNLCRAVRGLGAEDGEDGGHVWAVAEVVGQVSSRLLGGFVQAACRREGVEAAVERVELRHLPAVGSGEEGKRGEVVGDNDHELGRLLETLGDSDYTVMVFSDPNEFKAYEPEFAAPVHMDMRRWAEKPEESADSKSNSTTNLPLFEKYQFFTPGIFMSFIVLAIILSILGVGLKALASLEVSYGAFDKEMGPAAQRKQM